MASNHSSDMVTEFEGSFQACLAALTNEDHFNVHDPEEIKAGVEQTLVKFLEMAKQMECFFLQKRLLLSAQKPEQLVREDINDLKQELTRKEQLIQKHYEKIQYWQSLLSNIQGPGPRPPHLQNQIPLHPPPPHTHTQLQHQLNVSTGPPQLPGPPPHLPPPPPPPPPPHLQALGAGLPTGMVPNSVPGPMSMMQSQGPGGGGGPMSQNIQVPSPMQGMNPNPSMYGLPPPNQSQLAQQMAAGPPLPHHPSGMHPGPHPGMHSGLQGPLAYLEKTTSNIGMPDSRQ